MTLVFLTAVGIGGATVIGSMFGFAFRRLSHKFSDIVIAFAAGVMLCAAIIGLILPSLEQGNRFPVTVTLLGVLSGGVSMSLLDGLLPHLHRLTGVEPEAHPKGSARLDRVLLFVLAIAIHNLPEGIAAGVSFGTEQTQEALAIAAGIALQNIPEGMVIIAPMLSAGVPTGRTFFTALFTGLIEVFGTLLGYFSVRLSAAVLPFALSFAGGTMLYVISDEMIPETHAHGFARAATFSLLCGFCLMLAIDCVFSA